LQFIILMKYDYWVLFLLHVGWGGRDGWSGKDGKVLF
jgi:hypothetical protein